jgi:hypothetical protein
MNIEFPKELFSILDQFYDSEWEAMLRPTPGANFEWRYAAFDGDKCLACPIVWTAKSKVDIKGFEIQLTTGDIFQSVGPNIDLKMIAGDSISLDHFVIHRSIYGYKPPVLPALENYPYL